MRPRRGRNVEKFANLPLQTSPLEVSLSCDLSKPIREANLASPWPHYLKLGQDEEAEGEAEVRPNLPLQRGLSVLANLRYFRCAISP